MISKSRITINNIKILATECYDLKGNTDCSICRCNLNSNSIYAESKGITSELINGTCGHTFHKECLMPWIEKNKHCPLCATVWTIKN